MAQSNYSLPSFELERVERDRDRDRERESGHPRSYRFCYAVISLSLSPSLARSLRTPFYPHLLLSLTHSPSLSHTHTRAKHSLSPLPLSLRLSLLPQLHSLLCCKFICCVKQQLAREWAMGFDPFVKRSPCECVLRPPAHHGTGRLALSNIAVPSWVYHDRASHLAEMGGTMRC